MLSPHSSNSEQLYVGVLLTTQPFFILGIENVSEARSNAFGAMGLFMATFVLSLFGILRSRSAKEDIDNADGYHLDTINTLGVALVVGKTVVSLRRHPTGGGGTVPIMQRTIFGKGDVLPGL